MDSLAEAFSPMRLPLPVSLPSVPAATPPPSLKEGPIVLYPDDPGKLHVFLLCHFLKLLFHVDVVSLHESLIEPDSPQRHSHSVIKFSVISARDTAATRAK